MVAVDNKAASVDQIAKPQCQLELSKPLKEREREILQYKERHWTVLIRMLDVIVVKKKMY